MLGGLPPRERNLGALDARADRVERRSDRPILEIEQTRPVTVEGIAPEMRAVTAVQQAQHDPQAGPCARDQAVQAIARATAPPFPPGPRQGYGEVRHPAQLGDELLGQGFRERTFLQPGTHCDAERRNHQGCRFARNDGTAGAYRSGRRCSPSTLKRRRGRLAKAPPIRGSEPAVMDEAMRSCDIRDGRALGRTCEGLSDRRQAKLPQIGQRGDAEECKEVLLQRPLWHARSARKFGRGDGAFHLGLHMRDRPRYIARYCPNTARRRRILPQGAGVVVWGRGVRFLVRRGTRHGLPPSGQGSRAGRLLRAPRPIPGYTSISGAIDFAARLFARTPWEAVRRVVDISGNGRNNDGRPAAAARDDAATAGITVNGLPILDTEQDLDAYYAEEVIGAPDAFLVVARDLGSFAEAIRRKLVREIAAAPANGRGRGGA